MVNIQIPEYLVLAFLKDSGKMKFFAPAADLIYAGQIRMDEKHEFV